MEKKKITEVLNIAKSQNEIDFLDINVEDDTRLFIDPFYISKQENEFAKKCDRLIKSFFNKLIDCIKNDDMIEAKKLCSHFSESSDVCLGYAETRGTAGSGMGDKTVEKFCYLLKDNLALQRSILTNIEDARILLDYIGADRISDMVANIIRKLLIEYTIEQCNIHGIKLEKTESNYFWDGDSLSWKKENECEQIVIKVGDKDKKILLVPKNLVSDCRDYSLKTLLEKYIIPLLQKEHKDNETYIVSYRKDGTKYVTKKAIKEHYRDTGISFDKKFCTEFVTNHPELFQSFREETKVIIGKRKRKHNPHK